MSKDIVDLGPPVISPTEQGYKLEWRPGPHTLYCFHISPAQAEAMIVGLLELVDQDRGGALRVRGNTRRWDGQPAERETWQVERLQWIKILGQYSTDGKAYDALREARPAMCEDRQSSRGSGEIIDGDDHFRDAGEIPPGSPLSDRVEQLEDELIAEEFDHHEALAIMIERGRRLDAIAEILELGDRRLLASDGPAGEQPPDLTLDEFRRMYLLAKGHDPDNELAGLVPVFVKTTDGQPLDRDRAEALVNSLGASWTPRGDADPLRDIDESIKRVKAGVGLGPVPVASPEFAQVQELEASVKLLEEERKLHDQTIHALQRRLAARIQGRQPIKSLACPNYLDDNETIRCRGVLEFVPGEEQTRDEPGSADSIACPECGDSWSLENIRGDDS